MYSCSTKYLLYKITERQIYLTLKILAHTQLTEKIFVNLYSDDINKALKLNFYLLPESVWILDSLFENQEKTWIKWFSSYFTNYLLFPCCLSCSDTTFCTVQIRAALNASFKFVGRRYRFVFLNMLQKVPIIFQNSSTYRHFSSWKLFSLARIVC